MNEKLLVIVAILAFFLITSLAGFLQSIFPFKFISKTLPSDLGFTYEDVSIETSDGITLAGWFIPHEESETAKTVILLHGYPADKGNILPLLAFLHERYNLLLFDFRGLGKSGGKISTAGAREVEDLRAAIRYLKSRGIEEMGVWGFSMGGAVALMVAPDAPEISVIVAESPYANLDLMAKELYRIPFLKGPLAYFTTLWAALILGVNPRDVAPVESAAQLRIPILLIHSQADDVIPYSHALLHQEALKENSSAEFWFPEELIHGEMVEEHQRRVFDFFRRHL